MYVLNFHCHFRLNERILPSEKYRSNFNIIIFKRSLNPIEFSNVIELLSKVVFRAASGSKGMQSFLSFFSALIIVEKWVSFKALKILWQWIWKANCKNQFVVTVPLIYSRFETLQSFLAFCVSAISFTPGCCMTEVFYIEGKRCL